MKIVSNEELSVGDMKEEMLQKKPLPIGREQFEEWSDRIIAGSLVEASTRSLKQALGHMLMHLSPTEAFREDAYFMLQLRNGAVKQTAHMMVQEIKAELKAEQKQAEDTAPNLRVADGSVLEKEKL